VHDVACIFSGLGNLLFLSLGYGTLIGFACWRRAWADLKFVVAVAVITTVIVQGTKLLIGVWTPRPSGAHGGFPSGHAASSFALATLLAYQFPRLSLLWYGIAAVISWSRVETNAHWYYQVAVGAVLGFLLPLYTARRFRISQSDAG
jgi:membrane-associated phospholipid phosphatase